MPPPSSIANTEAPGGWRHHPSPHPSWFSSVFLGPICPRPLCKTEFILPLCLHVSPSLVVPTGASRESFWGVLCPYPCEAVRCHLGTLLVSGPEVKGLGSVYQVTKITFSIASSPSHSRPGLCE